MSGLTLNATQLFDEHETNARMARFLLKDVWMRGVLQACDWEYVLDKENDRCLVMDSDKNKFCSYSMFEHYCIEIFNNMNKVKNIKKSSKVGF